MDPRVGQPNRAGAGWKLVCGLLPIAAAFAWLVFGLPDAGALALILLSPVVYGVLVWRFRRPGLTPLERWAADPRPFGRAPAWVWPTLTVIAAAALVPVALRWPLAALPVLFLVKGASQGWAWTVVQRRAGRDAVTSG